jgi:hypothetical protein
MLEWIEVTIAVQQGMAGSKAECSDEAINRLADRVAFAAQRAEILSGRYPDIRTSSCKHFKSKKLSLHSSKCMVVGNALQDLAEDDLGQPKSLVSEFSIQPLRLRVLNAAEIVNPNGRINNHHGC